MQVKVFEADDMPTALRMVKENLGPHALILSTRTVRKGSLGLLGKAVVEVTAAIDGDPPPVESPSFTPQRSAPPVMPKASAAAKPAPAAGAPVPRAYAGDDFDYTEVWRKRRVIDPLEEEVQQLRGQLSSINVDSLRGELDELRELVRASAQRPPAEPFKPLAGKTVTRRLEALIERGVDPELAEEIIRQGQVNHPPSKKLSHDNFLTAAIADLVRVCGPITHPGAEGPRKVALVGPTGVGKTTTVAKLAADYLLQGGRKLALVTIDIYRIAAAEQLKVYGEIMKVPVEVVFKPQDLQQIWARHRDKELILIDTSGRSPQDAAGLAELESFIGEGSGVENHLVLSATTRDREAAGALQRFSRLPISSLILSKIDECESLGGLLNLHLKHNFPLSYLTNGQRVPEDMVLAEPKGVASLIMRKQ